MHNRVKALIVAATVLTNSVSPTLNVLATELDREVISDNAEEQINLFGNDITGKAIKNLQIQPNKGSFDWGYSNSNEVAINVEFDKKTNTKKVVEIELIEGMSFNRYPVVGNVNNSVEYQGTATDLAVIKNVISTPTKDPVTNQYSGKLVYELQDGVVAGKIVFNASVDRYKYYGPKNLSGAIKVTVKENDVVVNSTSIDVDAKDHSTIGEKNHSLNHSESKRTLEIQPGGEGISYNYFRNITSGVQDDTNGIKGFTYVKSAVLTMYYPENTTLVSVDNLPKDVKYVDHPTENKVVINMPDPTIKNINVTLTYKVDENADCGKTIEAPHNNTMDLVFYDDTTKTLTASVKDSVKVVDPNTLSNTIDMEIVDGFYHDYNGESLSTSGYMYLKNKTVKEYRDQVFEYTFKDWHTRKVLLPDSMTTVKNIKYKLFGDSAEYIVTNDKLTEYREQKRLLDADALGIEKNKYFEKVTFEVEEIPVGFDDSTNGRDSRMAISFGELPKGIDKGSTTIKIYEKSNPTAGKTVEKPITRVTTTPKITISSGNTALKNEDGLDVKNSTSQKVLKAKTTFEANKGYNRIYNASNYLENPEIIIRMPKGFHLSTGTIKLTQNNVTKNYTISDHISTVDGAKIYTLQTQDVKIGGFNPDNLEMNPGINVEFEFLTDASVGGTYNLNDIIFIGKKDALIEEMYADSGILVKKDTLGLIPGSEQVGNEDRSLGRSQEKSFEIIKNSELIVTANVREPGSNDDKPPYNKDDESTAIQVSKGTLIDFIVKVENNYENEAEDFDVYIPIPKKGSKLGDEIQINPFTWDMELQGDPEIKIIDKDGNPITINNYFEISYGKVDNNGQATYESTYTQDKEVIKVIGKQNIQPGTNAEIKFTFKASDNVDQADVGKLNVFNAYYHRRYDNGTIDVRLKGNYIGLRLAIGEIKGIAFLDKNNDGLYNDTTDDVLANVEVQLWDKNKGTLVSTVQTNSLGEYKFDGLANGEYEVKVTNNGGSLDISDPNARRFTRLTALSGDSYKNDSDIKTTDNVNGVVEVSVPTTSYVHDNNEHINIGFIEPITVNMTTDNNGSLSGTNSGSYKAWPFTMLQAPETVKPNLGYRFVNYINVDSGQEFTFPSEATSDISIRANFEKMLFRVILNENGGNPGSVSQKEVLFDESIKISLDSLQDDEKPTRPGYKFIGWSENNQGNTIISDSEKMPASDITLYAVWDKAPEIHGVTDTTIKVGSKFNSLDGITATDREDTSLTIVVSGDTVNENIPGEYNLTYTVTDSVGNVTTANRVVKVDGAPEIHGATNTVIKLGSTFDPLHGVTVTDNEDRNLTIEVTGDTVDVNKSGIYNLTYTVQDSIGNVTVVNRQVKVNAAPEVTGINDIELKVGEVDEFNNNHRLTDVQVSDDHDPESAIRINVTGDVGKPAAGTDKVYQLTYEVIDSDGFKTEVIRNVKVTNQKPVITANDVMLRAGNPIDLLTDALIGLEATDHEDGNIKGSVKVKDKGNLDTNNPKEGIYRVIYEVTDKDQNTTEKVVTVTIESNNAPIINGANDIELKVGQVDIFNSQNRLTGVTVSDDHDTIDPSQINITGDVFKPLAGTTQIYKLKYEVTDSDGNKTEVIRNVTVTNQKPKIVANDVTIRAGRPIDLLTDKLIALDATDHEDGNIKGSVSIKSDDGLDQNNPVEGAYRIVYEVTDSDNNTTEKEITVTVESNNAPIINGATDIVLKASEVDEFNTNHRLTGIMATDDHDATDSLKINVAGDVLKPAPGTEQVYKLRYEVTDSDGNRTEVIRNVKVTNHKPVITANDVTVRAGKEINLLTNKFIDLNASDYEDGNITGSVTVKSNGGLNEKNPKEGVYAVVYKVTDKDNNVTEKEITVTVESNTAPIINGIADIELKASEVDEFNANHKLTGVMVSDDHDTIDPSQVKVTGDVHKPTPGTDAVYKLKYEVTDSDGNTTEFIRNVKVTNQKPVITANDVVVRANKPINLLTNKLIDLKASDYEDGDIKANVVIKSDDGLDKNNPAEGVYRVVYEVTDKDNNVTQKAISVTVESNTAPIINGANDIELKVGQVDEFNKNHKLTGVMVSDDHDTIDPSQVKVTGEALKPLPGNNEVYALKYEVTDDDGNTTEVIRNVTVTNQKPVITANDVTIRAGKSINLLKDKLIDLNATDHEDGNIKSNVVVKDNGGLDEKNPVEGIYRVVFEVTDSDNNVTEKAITVTVETNNVPIINGATDIELKVGQVDIFNAQHKLTGVTVSDDHDTIDPSQINITGDVFKPAAGTDEVYQLKYEVTDSDGNTTEVIRNVKVTNQKPVITANDITIRSGKAINLLTNKLIGLDATDYEDGNLKDIVTVKDAGGLDEKNPVEGVYRVVFEVKDSDNNVSEKAISVTVESNTAPIINGANDIELKVGQVDEFNKNHKLTGVMASDDHDPADSLQVNVFGDVHKPLPGSNEVYQLKYEVIDGDGNKTEVVRNVTVTNQKPVITANDVTVRAGEVLNLLTNKLIALDATDYEDGNIKERVTVKDDGGLDQKNPAEGVYRVVFEVTDSDNNVTEKAIIVTVESNNSPIINGAKDIELKVGQVDEFNAQHKLTGVTVSDDHDKIDPSQINITGEVFKPLAGTDEVYQLKYEVTDSDGNTTEVIRNVKVTNQKPVITANDITIRSGKAINLLTNKLIGLDATDYEDGNIKDRITVKDAGGLDESNPVEGVYRVVFEVKDSDNNITEKAIAVNVESNNVPVINGANDIELKVGQVDIFNAQHKLTGVMASDDHDPADSLQVKVFGDVHKPLPGSNEVYQLKYEVTDSDGNKTEVVRNITVTNQKPVITANDVTVRAGEELNLLGNKLIALDATDHEDGNIKDRVTVKDAGGLDEKNPAEGVYRVVFEVKDSDNNITEKDITVTVESNNAPIINGIKDIELKVGQVDAFNSQHKLTGVMVSDDHDKIDPSQIKVTGDVFKPAAGSNEVYKLKYEVTDSDGNTTEVIRNVKVTNQKPVITANDIVIRAGKATNLLANKLIALDATDYEDGNIKDRITVKDAGGLDEKNPVEGVYRVVYEVTDSDNNVTEKAISVTVESNNVPVINGATDIELKVGQVDIFNAQHKLTGVMASDDHDSADSLQINVFGEVHKPLPGSNEVYTLKYEVTDADGNKTEVIRNVTVTNQKPVITANDVTIRAGEALNLLTNKLIGLDATDHEDGNIKDRVKVNNIDGLDEKNPAEGVYRVVFEVKDSDNNIIEKAITVTVESNNSPIINGANDIELKVGQVDAFNSQHKLTGVMVSDDHDKIDPSQIKVTGDVFKPTPGTDKVYQLNYSVVDADGNKTEVIRNVKVTNQKPVITANDVVIRAGKAINLLTNKLIGLDATDYEDGNLKDIVTVKDAGGLDEKNPVEGVYRVVFEVKDSDNNITEKAISVTVESNEVPIINGANDIELKVSQVDKFNKNHKLTNVIVNDDHDPVDKLQIDVVGEVLKPAPGTDKVYQLNYSVVDSDGNKTEVIRNVKVTNQKPVITANDITIREGEALNLFTSKLIALDARDYEDGDIKSNVTIKSTGGLNEKNPTKGVYRVVYEVKDSDNNTTEEEITVTVDSKDAPIINGANDIELKVSQVDEFNKNHKLTGIIVSDDKDIIELSQVKVSGEVGKADPGTNKVYQIKYEVVDSDGNTTTAIRNITVTNQKPKMTANDATIRAGKAINLLTNKLIAVDATDYEDGNIKDKVTVKSTGGLDEKNPVEGKYTVVYEVTDSDNNVAEKEITVTVEPNSAIIINGANDIELKVSEVDDFNKNHILTGVTINLDKPVQDVEPEIKTTGKADKPEAGTNKVYQIKYEAVDEEGNVAEVIRNVTVTNQKPEITANDITIRAGQSINLLTNKLIGLEATDYEDGNLKEAVSLNSSNARSRRSRRSVESDANKNLRVASTGGLDENNPAEGIYTVLYQVTDSDDNTTEKEITVTVESNNAPEINGVSDTTINFGDIDSFKEQLLDGVTVSDDHDTIDVSSIKITGEIGKPEPGTNKEYTITYEVKDSDRNLSTVERVITVTNQIPEIEGLDDIIIRQGEGKEFDFASGVTATDNEDGVITERLEISELDLSTLPEGIHSVKYKVVDSDGNVKEVERRIIVLSNTLPTIIANDITIEAGKPVDLLTEVNIGLSALDYEDGNITDKITIKSTGGLDQNNPKPGTYKVVYEVVDTQGNIVEKEITVTVNENKVEIETETETTKEDTKENTKEDTNKNNSANPETGDKSLLGYLGLGLASLTGLLLNRKKKK